MKTVYSYILIASIGVLAACTSYGEDLAQLDEQMKSRPASHYAALSDPSEGGGIQTIEPAAGGNVVAAADLFADQLARGYYTLAIQENNVFDYKAAALYTNKAMNASKGERVMPSRLTDYDIPKSALPALKEAHQSLMTALSSVKTYENASPLAKAQVSYDCWLEKTEEAQNEKHVEACAHDFNASMAGLVTPAAGEQLPSALIPASAPVSSGEVSAPVFVSFDPNTATMSEGAASTLDQITAFLTSEEGKAYAVSLAASTSAGVSSPFSERLIQTRMDAVRSALVARGIDPSRFLAASSGRSLGSGAGASQSVEIHVLPPVKGMQPIL